MDGESYIFKGFNSRRIDRKREREKGTRWYGNESDAFERAWNKQSSENNKNNNNKNTMFFQIELQGSIKMQICSERID